MMVETTLGWILLALASLVAVGTALSEVRSYQWWIRGWDFPRAQLASLGALLLFGGWLLAPEGRLLLGILLVPSIVWQLVRIYPYTPLAPKEVRFVKDAPQDACFKALAFNVLEDNRRYERASRMLEREDPDIVLLLETDRQWVEALEPFISRYPHRLDCPLDNKYGLTFATRLNVVDSEIRFIADDCTPSIFARLRTRDGQEFLYMGLHPRPPVPGQDSEERDAEIAIAARYAKSQNLPTLTMGDFNDVAWSHTSHLFKRLGSYMDPRVGRGPYSTFPAGIPFLRWPLDHLYMSPDFVVLDLRVLEKLGSDHLPLIAHLALIPDEARRANGTPPEADGEDQEEADEIIEDQRESG